jgi:hypothetical protein
LLGSQEACVGQTAGPPKSMPHSFLFAANRFLLLQAAAAVCRPLFYGRVYGPAFASQRQSWAQSCFFPLTDAANVRRAGRRDSSENGRTSCQPLVIIPAPYYYDLAQLSATASVINSFLMMSFHYVRGKSFLPVCRV